MNLKRYFLTLLLCAFAVSLPAATIVIGDGSGGKINVEIAKLAEGKVEVRLADGTTRSIPMKNLSKINRRKVIKWQKSGGANAATAEDTPTNENVVPLTTRDRIKVYVHTRRDSKDTDGGYDGWKDMDEKIEPRVVIDNQEYRNDYNNLTATVVLVAEGVRNKSELKVVYKDKFKFSASNREKFTWNGKPFKLDYLVDDNDGYDNSYGHRYRYYFVVIRNADGTVGHVSSSRSSWESNPDLIDKLVVNRIYNRNLQ
ncbi:MAG: hypothetical protein ACSHX8_07680 [Opitutaceae bacterium]